jgi:hypothetical protein
MCAAPISLSRCYNLGEHWDAWEGFLIVGKICLETYQTRDIHGRGLNKFGDGGLIWLQELTAATRKASLFRCLGAVDKCIVNLGVLTTVLHHASPPKLDIDVMVIDYHLKAITGHEI